MLYFSKNKLWKVIKFENSAECRTLVSANCASPFFFSKTEKQDLHSIYPDTYPASAYLIEYDQFWKNG